MKSITGWEDWASGTNASGFSGLPGGQYITEKATLDMLVIQVPGGLPLNMDLTHGIGNLVIIHRVYLYFTN